VYCTWKTDPLPTVLDSGDVSVLCTFSNIPGHCSSWNCQKLAAEQLLARASSKLYVMAGGTARP
jgi:hypothetical protein